jgi:transketolase
MAIDAKYNVYALLGDGELEEGSNWEAFMFASKNKLNNLCFIIDYNKLQLVDETKNIAGDLNLESKLKSFGLNVITIDGHNQKQLLKAFEKFKSYKKSKNMKPTAIIANTVKGKGVSFMENQVIWHGKALNEEEFKLALAELGG